MSQNQKLHVESELKRLHAEIDSLKGQLEDKQRILFDRRMELIGLTCPYRVGQRLKNEKNEYEISEIRPEPYSYKDWQYQVFARKVLKSGKLHQNITKLYSWDLRGLQSA